MQAMGNLFIVRPAAMLAPPASTITKAALQRDAPKQLKIRALTNLAELLKVCFSKATASSVFVSKDAAESSILITWGCLPTTKNHH